MSNVCVELAKCAWLSSRLQLQLIRRTRIANASGNRQSAIGSHNRNHNQKRNRLSMPTCNDMLTSNDNLIERNEPICIAIARWRWRRCCSGTVCLCFGRRNVYLRTYLGVECVVLQLSNCLGINKMACSSNNVNVQQIPKQTNRRRRSGGSHWQRRWSEVSKQKSRMSADWYYPVRQLHSYTHTHTPIYRQRLWNMAVSLNAFPFSISVAAIFHLRCQTARHLSYVMPYTMATWCSSSLAFLLYMKMSVTFAIIGLLIIGK